MATELFHQRWDVVSGAPFSCRACRRPCASASRRTSNCGDRWDAHAPASCRITNRSHRWDAHAPASWGITNRSHRWDAHAPASWGIANRCHRWNAHAPASWGFANRGHRWDTRTSTAWWGGQHESVPGLWVRSHGSGLLWLADEGGYTNAR